MEEIFMTVDRIIPAPLTEKAGKKYAALAYEEFCGENAVEIRCLGGGSFGMAFSVTAKGGKGAFKGCVSNTTDVNKAQVANNGQRKNALGIAGLSDGGLAGDVTIYDRTGVNNKPARRYNLSMYDDTDPAGRWKVEPAGKGLDGMIVVSW